MTRWVAMLFVRRLVEQSGLVAAVLALAAAPAARAQGAASGDTTTLPAVASWIALDAAPGREQSATAIIEHALPGWQRDALGNLVLRRGSGSPRRVVACALDEPGFVVSGITADGYLRLHDPAGLPRHPLWVQFHEGQRIIVHTRHGGVSGVIGVRSVHLWRGASPGDAPATIDRLWVDVGARNRADVKSLGIGMLDPVSRDWPRWVYADLVAGPAAADRVGCAAVAAASTIAPEHGETDYVISVQSAFRWTGLSAVLASLGGADTFIIAAARGVPAAAPGGSPVIAQTETRTPFAPIPGVQVGTTIELAVRALYPRTLVESVRESDVEQYAAAIARAAGIASRPPLVALDVPAVRTSEPHDSLADAAALLRRLSDTYGVSGHEAQVRDAVRAALPEWAAANATVDTAGNLIVAVGPDRDTAVFVAHMDEVGWAVTKIAADGAVSLERRGGFLESLWEGQTAIAHVDTGEAHVMVRGIFVPRDSARTEQPAQVTAWFGLDSAALAAKGVTVGTTVTSSKRAARFGATRFSARSLDDRTGCTAQLLAMRALNPAALTHKVIFAFSVREETGLFGAAALAATWGPSVKRVHAIDTFVSSDAPLESDRFADAPLGAGAVVRALDNSSATPPAEVDRVVALARGARIPIQVGTTNGGNDGSEFVRYGAVDVPIGWPLRYSHSPAEVIDLRDVVSLARVIERLARAP
ncbi:MAG TPA: M20/M25/M40 family metallo-hydrolase, partial [Gemmatimonadaceae bacterium]|nr:M20/M25/M40 family metallo-hydrolase [Gemmatimonadaceae bacterium]